MEKFFPVCKNKEKGTMAGQLVMTTKNASLIS